jgi:hypothetical protein
MPDPITPIMKISYYEDFLLSLLLGINAAIIAQIPLTLELQANLGYKKLANWSWLICLRDFD